MPESNLDRDGQERLERVVAMAHGNINALAGVVKEVLKGVSERGRRIYLRNELTRRAKRRIQAQERSRATQVELMMFVISPAKRLDAWRHEQALLSGVPEHDR